MVGNVADDASEASAASGMSKQLSGSAAQNAMMGDLPIQGMHKSMSAASDAGSATPNQFDLSMHSTISL